MTKPITIEDVKVITTQPAGSRLVIVKVITSEPGLYGLGCATFTQRWNAVVTALEKHLIPFALGRDVSRIEEFYRMATVHSYWRNGPVLNNAISGIDQALWDIKGKIANMPVYELLGGKCREAAACYAHANGSDPKEIEESVRGYMEQGYHHIRVQAGGYGGRGAKERKPEGSPSGAYYDPKHYMRTALNAIEHVRNAVGEEIEILHDIHERLAPIDAVQFAKDVEQYKLFFLEDALAPEDNAWFERIRQQCATPLAMGELYNNPQEWQIPVQNRWIDFIRMHVSQMGGITPAREAVLFSNMYKARTAWHGPGDTSPVGHAANLHLDLWAPNFGIQEWCRFPEHVYEIFPGLPEVRGGYMYPNDKPGLGIDIDEELAAKYPAQDTIEDWTQTRWPDGTPARP
ncbi:MAG: bifunctional D-altronate/D-mannonate dehydratase [Caldilineaceae bacterium]|nr:bifunctional D-altronate/D-mannonate dehydratase [Caldilineaceae bacterium]